MSQAPLRLGLFGGAFDPPHRAHVALAQAALQQLALDELRVLPTGQAWHKPQQLSAAEHRLAMARIAFGELPGAVVDDRELRRAGATYTIDTLRELQAERPGAQWFLVMGQDQARAFGTWREWQTIAALAELCVAARPVPAGEGAMTDNVDLALPPGTRVHRLQLPRMPESATEVRQRVAAGQGIAHLVPAGVARYIDQHHLYLPA